MSTVRFRPCDWVLVAYFLYTSMLALALPLRAPIPAVTLSVNGAVLLGFWLLAWGVGRHFAGRFFEVLRDWYAMSLVLLAYREMGWFAPAAHSYVLEKRWVVWDREILDGLGLRVAIEAFGPVLPSVLEISYSLVYAVPVFALAILYIYHLRDRSGALLLTLVLGVLGCYALFPLFPSEPPRTVFPGQDLPGYVTVFRRFNLGLLRGYGIHTSVFPSAHVAGACASAFAMVRVLPEHPWVGRLLLVMAVLIATATVYGRYHYAADAAAGFGLAVIAEVLTRFSQRRIS